MSRELTAPADGGVVASQASSTVATDVASVLRDKDNIIHAQARRIGQLEREAERVRRDRDSLATKVALLTYKLQMYSKDLHHSRQPPTSQNMNLADRNRSSDNRSSEPSSTTYCQNRVFASPSSQFREAHGVIETRSFSPQPKTVNISNVSRSVASDNKLPQRPHRLQKRTSDEDEKIKRSRDWDYELSLDLQAKQIEMLEKKYGGSLRASRAARIIQQAYRQYCLNRNFAKLRLEADTKRLSRRFTDFGRSKTLWTDMVTTVEYSGASQIQRSVGGSAALYGSHVYGSVGSDVVPTADGIYNISHGSAAYGGYLQCKYLHKSLSMSVTSAERNVVRECPQPPVRYTQHKDLNTIREASHDSNFNAGNVERVRNDNQRQSCGSESGHRHPSVHTRGVSEENLPDDSDVSDWHVEKSGPSGSFTANGSDDELAVSSSATTSYVDHNLIDNNLDLDIEGNSGCISYGDLPLESAYCDYKCVPLGMPMTTSQPDPYPGYYDGIQVCRIPQSMAPPPVPTSSPSGHVYSSLRLCTLKHGTPMSSPAVENLTSKQQPSAGSPIWKRKNFSDGFGYAYEGDIRDPNDRASSSSSSSTPHTSCSDGSHPSRGVSGGLILQQNAYQRGGPTTCNDCAQLLHHYHHHHHHHHHHHMLSQTKVSDKQRKRTYRIGLNLFNKKPEKGIRYLIERRFLDNRPNAVARFLISRKGLSKQMIGEYLGNLQKQFNMEVLRCFAEEIDLTGLEIDVALRKFQSYFRMPGEAQKIERLMEAFASQYCQCNPHVVRTFRRADTVFLLAFATIMLNTDLHNKSIKPERKMKLQDFIRNLRGIDDGEDIDPNLLTGIYERMKLSEFQPGSDHVTQVSKVEQSIIGKRPQLTALHRRLVCYCRLYEVQDLSRKEKLGLHQREVFLFNDMLMVTKILGKKKNSASYSFRSSFSLSGMIVYLFDTPHYKFGIQLKCSSNKKDYVMLYARNEHDRSKFVEDLKEAILEMNEMEALRIEEELQKQKIQQKHCNYNRHSKDSGVVDIELLRPSDFAVNRHSTADCASISRAPISGSLVDMSECGHRGSAGSLDSGLVSIHAQCDHVAG